MNTGAGRIYKRGATYWIDFSNRGQRHRESSESTLKKDAQALLRTRLAEIAQGKLPGRAEEKLRLADARDAIVDDYRIHGRKTAQNLCGAFNHLERHLGNCPLLSITTGRIRRYIADRQDEGAAAATIQNEMAALRRALNILHQDGQLSRVPHIPSPEVNNTRRGFFEAADLAEILKYLPEHAQQVARFAYLTGWRHSEILGLKWTQVDHDAEEIRLEPGTTKNKEGRTFPFGTYPPLGELLTELLERTRQTERTTGTIIPWVFHYRGKQLKSIRSAWCKARKDADLPGAWFHDLRRSAVRNLERAGVSRSVAMKLTGHKTEAVYRRYAIADKTALEEGVSKLAALNGGKKAEERTVVPIEEARNV